MSGIGSTAIPRDVSKTVNLVEPYATPVTQICNAYTKREACYQPLYEMMHDTLRPQKVLLTSGTKYSSSSGPYATWTDLANVSFVQPGSVVRNLQQGQNFRVTGVDPSTGAINLVTVDGSAVASPGNTDTMLFLGDPLEEGGTYGSAKTTQVTFPYNYTQIFQKPFGITNTARASKTYYGNDYEYQKMKAMKEIKWDVERALLYGIRSNSAIGPKGNPINMTGGLMDPNIISTNRTKYPVGALTWSLFVSWFKDEVFAYGQRKKVLFGNNAFMADVLNVAQGNIRIEAGYNKDYGLDFSRWITPYGVVSFVLVPQLEEPYGVGIAVEPERMKMRTLRELHTQNDIAGPREDVKEDCLVWECGFQYCPEETASIFTGNQ